MALESKEYPALTGQPIEQQARDLYLSQTKETNSLAHIHVLMKKKRGKHSAEQAELFDDIDVLSPDDVDLFNAEWDKGGRLKVKDKSGTVVASISDFLRIKNVTVSTRQLFDEICMKFSANSWKRKLEHFTLQEHMELRGLNSVKSATEELWKDLETLSHISIPIEAPDGGGMIITICDVVLKPGDKRDGFGYLMPSGFYSLMRRRSSKMYYPPLLFQLDGRRNPHSYDLLRKLTEYTYMSKYRVIATERLIAAVNSIQTREQLRQRNRALNRHIVAPFIRDMGAIQSAVKTTFEIDGKIYELEDMGGIGYDELMGSKTLFDWVYYPERRRAVSLDTTSEAQNAIKIEAPRKQH